MTMIKVKFFTLLRLMLKTGEIDINPDDKEISVYELLRKVEKKIKKTFLHKLLDKEGKLLRGTIILINGKNILHMEKLDTIVKDNDTVSLFPPGGGG